MSISFSMSRSTLFQNPQMSCLHPTSMRNHKVQENPSSFSFKDSQCKNVKDLTIIYQVHFVFFMQEKIIGHFYIHLLS
jgi:hypothetical protein